MATINFFIRTTQKNKPANIRCRLRAGREVDIYGNTHIKVLPSNWNSRNETIKELVSFETREKFVRLKNILNEIILDKTTDDFNSSPEKEMNWLQYQIEKFHNPKKFQGIQTLFEFIDDFIEKAPTRLKRDGQPVCYKMQREYSRTFQLLKEFAQTNGFEPDFNDIDLDFYEEFLSFLQNKNLAANTIGKKIQTLKIFLNAATDRGLNHNLKFKNKFYAISEESDTVYLTVAELKKLWEYDLSNNQRLETVRDLFLIGCWTGCRYSDYKQINYQNIRGEYIFIEQQKTVNKVVIPVHPVVRDILEKYNGELPKVISNQKFNKYMKEVVKNVGINELIEKSITRGGLRLKKRCPKYELVSSHTARRSFATNLYKQGFPSRSIMKISGHKTEQAFLKYIRVTDQEHAELLMNFWKDNGVHMKIV